MTDTITFYHNPMSRGRIVRWMLEEVGAPYDVKLIRFDRRENKDPGFLAINPMGKIPTIVHRGVVITEAAAICTYLADAFPEKNLSPGPLDIARGTYLRWLFFGAGCVEPAIIDKMFSRPMPDRPGSLGYGTYEDTLNALEKAITPGPFILGGRFSAADVYIGSQIGWGMMTKGLESRPVFQSYMARCGERPAYKRSAELDLELSETLKSQK